MATKWRPIEEGAIAIAHISDPHFGSDRAEEVWRLVGACLAKTVKPQLLLVTGDLVHTPEQRLYDQAVQAMDALGVDYFVCSGNHDRHVLGNRVEEKRISSLLCQPPIKTVTDAARSRLQKLMLLSALPIGAVSALAVRGFLSLFADPTLSWTVSAILGVIVVGFVATSPKYLEGRATKYLLGKAAPFDSGATNDLFETTFADHLLSPNEARPVVFGSGAGKWEIGLLGLESSRYADCFARGKILTEHMLPLTSATLGRQVGNGRAEFDLCFLLVHHHLLPIRALEADRVDDAWDLLNATCLVNSGTLLERLAESRVDLVLHGHEHKHNWCGYQSMEEGYGAVRVVAAGSATGNNSFKGCREAEASFNVIILAPDRAVRLRRMLLEGGGWRPDAETDHILFTPEEVRQSRVRRRALIDTEDSRAAYKSEIVKYAKITPERDIQVYWLWTNWMLMQPKFEHKLTSSTSEPANPVVKLSAENEQGDIVEAFFHRIMTEDRAWNLCFDVPERFLGKPIRVSIQYTWRAGAMLTSEDLDALNHDHRLGEFRNDGFEYWTTKIREPIAALELNLDLPFEYAPEPEKEFEAGVEVRVHDGAIKKYKAESLALQLQLRALAKGQYSLRIPFPRMGCSYTLCWKPVAEKTVARRLASSGFSDRFLDLTSNKAELLLKSFAEALKESAFSGCSTLALYTKSEREQSVDGGAKAVQWAERLAHLSLSRDAALPPAGDAVSANDAPVSPAGEAPSLAEPPKTVCLAHERNLLLQSFWGLSIREQRPDDPYEARNLGFEPGEIALVCVPMRFTLSGIANPPTWGVVRIGISEKRIGERDGQDLSQEIDDTKLNNLLCEASAQLLARFFHEQ